VTNEGDLTVRGIRVASRVAMNVDDVSVEVVADEAAAKAVATQGDDPDKAFDAMVQRYIETHRLLDLDVTALTRIIVSEQKPADSLDLFEPNTQLWDRLQPGGGRSAARQKMQLWLCSESDQCQCCYCVPVGV
jgi:hypothetical protein